MKNRTVNTTTLTQIQHLSYLGTLLHFKCEITGARTYVIVTDKMMDDNKIEVFNEVFPLNCFYQYD